MKDSDKLKSIKQTSNEMIRGLEHLLFEESLRDNSLLILACLLEKIQVPKHLKPISPYLRRGDQKDGARLITKVQLDIRESN